MLKYVIGEEGAIGMQILCPARIPRRAEWWGGLMLGTVVPTSLQQALEIDPAAEVRHSMIVTVPGYSLADLGSLQAVDNS